MDEARRQLLAEIAAAQNRRVSLWAFERRQQLRLAEIEERLPVLASDMEPGSLHLQRVKCGPNCRCNNGTGHGPYYFLYRSTPAGLVKRYVRKSEVEGIQRRLRNYREYRALVKEADRIEEFLDVGAAKADIRLASRVIELLKKA